MFPRSPLPKRPYRNSAIVYGAFAIAFVVVIAVTGGNLLVGIPVAAGCFVLATGYAWWSFRRRIEEEEKRSP